MTRTAATTTLDPRQLRTGTPIVAEDIRASAELVHFAAQEGHANNLVGTVTGAAGWGSSGNEIRAHGVVFPATSGFASRYSLRLYVHADVQQITAYTTCWFPAAEGGDVRITIGGTAVTISHTAGETQGNGTWATATVGTGWLAVTVEIDHTTGSSTTGELRRLFIGCSALSSLPAPTNE